MYALWCRYECIAGEPPFWSEDDVEQVQLILRPERLKFPPELFGNTSRDAIELMTGLLQPDPARRMARPTRQ